MKKLVAISVLFALLTGAAFAQVTFSGSVATGIRMNFGDNFKDQTPNMEFAQQHIGNGNTFLRLDLNGAFTHSSGKAGGNFQLRLHDRGALSNNITDNNRNAWVWYQPLDVLRISAGILEVGSYNTPSRADARNDVGRGTGIHFDLTPMDGLSIGLTINPGSTGDSRAAALRFGLRYQMPDVFVAVANVGLNRLGYDPMRVGMAFGVNILALKDVGLTELSVDANIADLQTETGRPTTITIGQRVQFASGDVALGLAAHEVIVQDQDWATMRFHFWGSYKIGDITPRLDVGLGMNRPGSNDPRAWDGTGKTAAENNTVLIINPNVAFVLGGPSVTIGYGANVGMVKDGDTSINHGIYVNFGISF